MGPGSIVGKFRASIVQQSRPVIPPQLHSYQVLLRILFRLVLLIALAIFGGQGFGQTFAALLTLSAVFCIVVGTMRREAIFGPTLTHWDEAAVYAIAHHLVILQPNDASGIFISHL
jgi:hypothetical protein